MRRDETPKPADTVGDQMVYCGTCQRHDAQLHLVIPQSVVYPLMPAFAGKGMYYRQDRYPIEPVGPCTVQCAACGVEIDIKRQGFSLVRKRDRNYDLVKG